MGSIPIPVTPDEITPGWLTAVLRESGELQEAAVAHVSAQIIGEDRGFTSVVARLILSYDRPLHGETAPSSLIAKLPLAQRQVPSAYHLALQHNPEMRSEHYALAAREVYFYQSVAPISAIPTPHLYYGAADDSAARVVLLLEDLSAAREGDWLHGCTSDDAARVVEAIAPLHAQWWAQPHHDCFPWLPAWVGDPQAQQERYNRQLEAFLPRFGAQLPPFVLDLLDRLRSSYAAALTVLAQAPETLIHADLHLENLVFNPADTRRPVALLDWQGLCSGPGVADMALFVIGSLEPDARRAVADDLFQLYHSLLVGYGVSSYSLAHLREHARWALVKRLAGTVGWLSSANLPDLSPRERATVQAAFGDGRLIGALRDYDIASLLSF